MVNCLLWASLLSYPLYTHYRITCNSFNLSYKTQVLRMGWEQIQSEDYRYYLFVCMDFRCHIWGLFFGDFKILALILELEIYFNYFFHVNEDFQLERERH